MTVRLFFYILVLLLTFSGCKRNDAVTENTGLEKSTEDKQPPLFKKIAPEKSGVVFSNQLTENLETIENLFNFDYFYNGAGVGMEDLNNDGLLDIFFCGNQVENRLFMNRGDMTFEDVTEKAGINSGKVWSNGVTFADVNQDGWMDVYVSQGGPNPRLERKNLLFINQKNETFLEQGASFGLDDMGISTQSTFFDFDRDGDLDCIVMNENELYGVDPISLYKMVGQSPETEYFNSSHLYRNDSGKFVDVTKSSGIERPIFGLGLMVSDINNDGWSDIYIASDYYIPDALFINNKNGTFSDRIKDFTNQISYYGMGMDIADLNNDARQEIFVLDMASSDHYRAKTLMASMNTRRFDYLTKEAGFHYQYMFNSLQLNLGNDQFNNIAQLTQTAKTDWSWSVLMSDFDQDGLKDIFVTNGYRRYALDNDLQQKVYQAKMRYGQNMPLELKRELYNAMPSEKLPNIMYRNDSGLRFSEVARDWGLADFSFSNGAATGDLDNDGDLDLVVNNMDEGAFLYQNTATERGLGNYLKVKTDGMTSETPARITITYGDKTQFIETKRVRGYMSAHDKVAHFGLGKTSQVDTLRIEWPDGKLIEKYHIPANQFLTFNKADARSKSSDIPASSTRFVQSDPKRVNLDFEHRENIYDDFEKEILLPYKQSTLGPSLTSGDVNGDGKEDLYIGGASGQSGQLYAQTNSGFVKITSSAIENDQLYEDTAATFFDFDGDGDMDLYVVSGGNEFEAFSSLYADRIYLNDGKGNFSKLNSEILSRYPKSGKSVIAIDFDKDGDEDLLVGNRIIPKNYPKHAASTLLRNDNGALTDVTESNAAGLADFGIINQLIVSDFDNDGWDDFIAVGEWSPIGFFQNKEGIFERFVDEDGILDSKGWWFSVAETDVNNDGLKDYVLGNAGLNIKFKAGTEKPFKVYATDFDENGTNDVVLSSKYKGTYVPVRGRECSSQQMPFIKEKFQSYQEFANASLEDVYGGKLEDSYAREVTEFQSVVLINLGDLKFEKKALPVEAQQHPILAIEARDLNQDGYEDLVVAGNIYETEVETPRLDAISGTVLFSDGNNGYISEDAFNSGLYLPGNIKDIKFIELSGSKYLLAARNNGTPLLFEQRK
ncbi:FG-GAP-like repeat-containing protein [Poritiphilus flavus]|uniref:ASPIC/UnbV domain-containing protein n=1 Tax=Poritiphilus flavus TaxID=2697053 RepID=A0A6L9EHN8_9FLAO|nr:FG-GAP-like repeat-containing protein [Poritiphilus flavus]NAS14193.1 hypothetical protein [Poritiphilus flavus]